MLVAVAGVALEVMVAAVVGVVVVVVAAPGSLEVKCLEWQGR